MRRHYVFNNWISDWFRGRMVGEREVRGPSGREQETDVLEEVITMTEGDQCLDGSSDCGNGMCSSQWNNTMCRPSSTR
jgi:hypothetical protein